jgi:hypothetical protein
MKSHQGSTSAPCGSDPGAFTAPSTDTAVSDLYQSPATFTGIIKRVLIDITGGTSMTSPPAPESPWPCNETSAGRRTATRLLRNRDSAEVNRWNKD